MTELWWKDIWFLNHDNTPAHTVLSAQKFLVRNRTPLVLHSYPTALISVQHFPVFIIEGEFKGTFIWMSKGNNMEENMLDQLTQIAFWA
jgi:hypothetical protein